MSTVIGSQDSHEEVPVQDGEVAGEEKSSPRMVQPLRLQQERAGSAIHLHESSLGISRPAETRSIYLSLILSFPGGRQNSGAGH